MTGRNVVADATSRRVGRYTRARLGAVAQLVERNNRTVEARGSIPLSSTPSLAGSLLRGASSAVLVASGGRSDATEAGLVDDAERLRTGSDCGGEPVDVTRRLAPTWSELRCARRLRRPFRRHGGWPRRRRRTAADGIRLRRRTGRRHSQARSYVERAPLRSSPPAAVQTPRRLASSTTPNGCGRDQTAAENRSTSLAGSLLRGASSAVLVASGGRSDATEAGLVDDAERLRTGSDCGGEPVDVARRLAPTWSELRCARRLRRPFRRHGGWPRRRRRTAADGVRLRRRTGRRGRWRWWRCTSERRWATCCCGTTCRATGSGAYTSSRWRNWPRTYT